MTRRERTPATVTELREAVAEAVAHGQRVKALGAGRAGNTGSTIGDTDGIRIGTARLTGVLSADRDSGLVRVLAGTRLGELSAVLWQLGLSLNTIGDPDASVGGAISTGVHGSGARVGGLASLVRSLRLATAAGELIDIDRGHDAFGAAAMGLGALGVITDVTLQCEPAHALAAFESRTSLDGTLADLDSLLAVNDYAQFCWYPYTRRAVVMRSNRVLPGTGLRSARRLDRWLDGGTAGQGGIGAGGAGGAGGLVSTALDKLAARRPASIPLGNAVRARMRPARDYIDRAHTVLAAGTTPKSAGSQAMEYAVPREAVPRVLNRIEDYLARGGAHADRPVTVRFAAADQIWLSTAYGRDTGYIEVRQQLARGREAYFHAVEAIATDAGGRPHWGAVHWLDATALRAVYPRYDDFLAVRAEFDPRRVFGNAYLDRVLGR